MVWERKSSSQIYSPAEDTWQTIEESGWPTTPDILKAYRVFHGAHPRKAADLQIIEAIAT